MAEPYNTCNDMLNKQCEYVLCNEQLFVAFNNVAVERRVNSVSAKYCIRVWEKW